jgi:AcrR family transcriptional regulator
MATSELSADTRARILDAAFQRVRDGGTSALSVKDIAVAAGVSRQLVYFHYGSRAGLLLAMARHRDEASGFVAGVREARALEPVPAFEALLRAWCTYLPDMVSVARALEAALVTGDEGGSAWRDRMGELREALRRALEQVAGEERLAAGWTVETSADWAWSRIQPSTYAHLVQERGWTHAEYERRTVASLLAELVSARGR